MVWSVALSAALAIGAVSCVEPYNDTDIWEEIDQIKGDIAALKERVEGELTSLRELINGLIVVSEVVEKTDGSVEVKLSNDQSFTLYPKGDAIPSNLITVVEMEDGLLYWAMYDKGGQAQPIKINGEYAPVYNATPKMRVAEDGKTLEVSFDGGQTWIVTGYTESVADLNIEDIEVVYSEWQVDEDENPIPLYCIITINGVQVKVGMNCRIIVDSDYLYVPAGSNVALSARAERAVDFATTAPEGWTCNAELKAETGSAPTSVALSIVAPSSDAVTAGKAVADGVVKLYVVFDNGLSAISSIKVSSSDPIFMSYTMDSITITSGGVDEIVCGLIESASFTAELAAENANKYFADATQKSAYSVVFSSEQNSVSPKAKEINPDLKPGVEYTFWYAIPTVAEDGKKSVTANDISKDANSCRFIDVACTITPSFFDAEVSLSVKGSAGYKIGLIESLSYSSAALLDKFSDETCPLHTEAELKGLVTELVGVDADSLEAGVGYTLWYLECGDKTTVTTNDIVAYSFKTNSFAKGGDLELTSSDKSVKQTSFSLKLNSVGHIYIYYYTIKSSEIKKNTTDSALMDMLLKDGTACKTTQAVTVENNSAELSTAYTVLAVGVDANGKYGKLFKEEITTTSVEYNNLTLSVEVVGDVNLNKASLKATSEGAAGFAYMYVSNRSTEWLFAWDQDKDLAGEFMAGNLNSSYVQKVDANGTIELRGLDLATANDKKNIYEDSEDGEEKILVDVVDRYDSPAGSVVFVGALDSEGLISKVEMVELHPAKNYGTLVTPSDAKWAQTRPDINVYDITVTGNYKTSWYVTPAAGCTAYSYASKSCQSMELATVEELLDYIIANTGIENTQTQSHKYGTRCAYHASASYMYIYCEWGGDLNGDGFVSLDEYVPFYETGLVGANCIGTGEKGDFYIFTTWVDADGNFYEPSVYDPELKNDDGTKGGFIDLKLYVAEEE